MAKKKRTPSQIGKLAQAKGKAFNKEVCRHLAEKVGVPEEELCSSMPGLTGGDASLSRAAKRLLPFSIECKNTKQINLAMWIAQAEADAEGAGYPFLLVFKLHNRRKRYVTLELDEFLEWIT